MYVCMYVLSQVKLGVSLCNVILSNNLLMNLYFKNLTFGLHVLYVLNMHTNFHTNWMLFTIQSLNSFFMHYFEL